MKTNDSVGHKRKYNEMAHAKKKDNVKNIPLQTKREIQAEKKKLKKGKTENRKSAGDTDKSKQEEHGTSTPVLLRSEKDTTKVTIHVHDKTKHDGDPVKKNGIDNVKDYCTPRSKHKKREREVTNSVNISTVTAKPSDSSCNKTADDFEASGINVFQYAESRAFEIMNLQHALKEAKYSQNSRVFQTLPRHMRRRAASHDIRRIPKRLREKAKNENVAPKKSPSRKYKRRPRNLMAEYNRRSKLHSWLETHMWHSKRFTMIDQWGYRVPEKPCDKAFRAIYRASAKSCLLQDKSYMEFIEIIGCEKVIIKGFERITNSKCLGGTLLNDEKCLSGKCYGEELIYSHDSYPYHIIGFVKFIWEPAVDESQRKLIINCHPCIALQIKNELEVIFSINDSYTENVTDVNRRSLQVVEKIEKNLMEESNDDNKLHSNSEENGESPEIMLRNILDARPINNGESITTNQIRIVHHKLDFVMFSLTGPLSLQILQTVFTFPQHGTSSGVTDVTNDNRTCWNVSNVNKCQLHNLSVEDPRFHIPAKKQNPFAAPKIESTSSIPITKQQTSLIWDESLRKTIKDGKLSDEEINQMRNQQLIPGSTLPVKSLQIPVVVMQRPSRNLHSGSQGEIYGSAFDIILPAGWAMPFWIALVYQGACVGGVKADENISLEALSTHFPTQYPDSKARQKQVVILQKEKLQKHNRYPPDKRMNYDKLGCKHPFSIPWFHLVAEWKHVINLLIPEMILGKDIYLSKCDNAFYVLREKALLCEMKILLSEDSGKCGHDKEIILKELLRHPDSVILVSVSPLQDGIPNENATLCIPSCEDIAMLKLKKTMPSECDGWTEPRHRGRKREFPYICKKFDILLPNAATIGGNTRWIIGYVQNGGYSFTKAKGCGLGFISAIGLIYLLHVNEEKKLLFRNTNTLQYKFCNFEVLL